MTKIFTGKLLVILISMIICAGIGFACAGGDWDEEFGVSNFTPEVFVDSAYSPFFYSGNFYYHIGHDENQNTRFNYNNAKEWFGFFNNAIPYNELHYILETASASQIDSMLDFVSEKSNSLPDTFRSFQIVRLKKNIKVSAFLNYLQLAKKCEAFAVKEIQYEWEYDSSKKKVIVFDAAALNKNLESNLGKSKDIFLKERYWFQLERSFFFNQTPEDVIILFDKYAAQIPHNTIYFRALAYYAGAFYKMKEFSKANFYYSKVYDSCDELKTTAHYSFHPQEEKDWKATLALCSTKDEQATLWQMLGVFYTDEKRAIDEIYKLDPASDKLNLLLARSINKYEQKFNFRNDFYDELPRDTSEEQHVVLRKEITSIANAANTNKPWIWYLAAGYINTLDSHYEAAKNYYEKASKIIPADTLAQAQFRLLKLINKIAATKKIDYKLENEMVGEIQWLRGFENNPSPGIRGSDAFNWVRHVFYSKYKKQNELAKAECFFSKTSFYADDGNLEKMKIFLAKKQKTPYEELCTELSAIKIKDIAEFEMVKMTFEDNFEGAVVKIQDAGDAAGVLPANPFNGRLQDCHDCDQAALQKIKYSRASFLKKLKEIKDNISAGKDIYNNAVLLANAAYNITQYGNNRFFYECKILGESHSDPFYIENEYRRLLTDMSNATKYYSLALKFAQTDEQKARCNFMLAKCERNEWYNKHVYNKENNYAGDYMVDVNALDAFKELKKYPNTQYYKEVIKECGYFRNYIKK